MSADSISLDLPKPWINFLFAVDSEINEPVVLHCLGGFVVEWIYGMPRRTGDIDYFEAIPSESAKALEEIAGRESEIYKKYQLHFQKAAVAAVPEDYDKRLKKIRLGLKYLQLWVFDPYDLVLSKLTRNSGRDREDVKGLAASQNLSFAVLSKRYEKEMQLWIPNPERHDHTLQLWQHFFPR